MMAFLLGALALLAIMVYVDRTDWPGWRGASQAVRPGHIGLGRGSGSNASRDRVVSILMARPPELDASTPHARNVCIPALTLALAVVAMGAVRAAMAVSAGRTPRGS